jgi:hypothetical protein
MRVPLVALHNRTEIETYARRNPLPHLFELGDLDDFYWPHTVWYALKEADDQSAIACYTGLGFEQVAEFGAYSLEWSV